EIVVCVEVVGAAFERGREMWDSFGSAVRSKESSAKGIVGSGVGWAKAHRFGEVFYCGKEGATGLQQGSEIVVRLEIGGMLLDVVTRHRFLNSDARIGSVRQVFRQHLQPKMSHFVGSAIARNDSLRRMVRIADVVGGIVVGEPHRDGGALRQSDRLSVAKDGLPVEIPMGGVDQ